MISEKAIYIELNAEMLTLIKKIQIMNAMEHITQQEIDHINYLYRDLAIWTMAMYNYEIGQ